MKDRAVASILGVACGDALGAPTEFMKMDAIREQYGSLGIRDLTQTGCQYTDDTQMTLALAEGLLDAHRAVATRSLCGVPIRGRMGDPAYVMPFIAARFVAWSKSPENNRSPGASCMYGCAQLAAGVDWRESGKPNANGCGAAMRVAPVGVLYTDCDDIAMIARAQAIATHRSQEAMDAAHVAAVSVRLLLDGVEPATAMSAATVAEGVCAADFIGMMKSVSQRVRDTHPGGKGLSPWQAVWPSWSSGEAVASAWYCFLLAKHRNEGYVEAVRYAANTDGDSDSIAAITGSLAGAHWGIGGKHGVPLTWIERIENSRKLISLATRLYEATL